MKKSKHNNFNTLHDVLINFLKKKNKHQLVRQIEILTIWNREIDSKIKEIAYPDYFKNGTLFLSVESSIHSFELQFKTTYIIKTINNFLAKDKIQKIIIQIKQKNIINTKQNNNNERTSKTKEITPFKNIVNDVLNKMNTLIDNDNQKDNSKKKND